MILKKLLCKPDDMSFHYSRNGEGGDYDGGNGYQAIQDNIEIFGKWTKIDNGKNAIDNKNCL